MKTVSKYAKENLLQFLREEFLQEEAAGFARLALIPSTHVLKFLRYYKRLASRDAELLRSALSQRAFHFVRNLASTTDSSLWPATMTAEEAKAYRSFADGLVQVWWGWDAEPVKAMTNAVGIFEAGLDGCEDILPPEILDRADNLKTAKAKDLRKLIDFAFSQRHALTSKKFGSGVWYYTKSDAQSDVKVSIDYGGRDSQMRYDVTLRDEKTGIHLEESSFERLLGLSFSDWDLIVEGQADQKIALLSDLVDYVLRLPKRLCEGMAR